MTSLRKMLNGFDPKVADELVRFVERHSGKTPYRKIALFDADGTLWRFDLGEAFFRYQLEKVTIPHAPKSGAWDLYLKESTTGDTRKAFGWLAQWNAGVAEADLRTWVEHFFSTQWLKNVFQPMRELSHAFLNAGFEVWVISGSIKWVIEAGVKGFGIPADRVIGTQVEVENGVLTDRIRGIIPYREGKAELVRSVIGATPLFGAGNTYWDKELVDTASEIVLTIQSEKPGDPNYDSERKLGQIAESKGWMIQRF